MLSTCWCDIYWEELTVTEALPSKEKVHCSPEVADPVERLGQHSLSSNTSLICFLLHSGCRRPGSLTSYF
ncbi:hypothetical protein PISMIDRAFT_301264 [Pisolithus microcarpus 441]|uniref:Uncharacterized protein n=1 Tax=Pisolithus microcarpus 441 TaxID=765257 RepID=A0A0D0A836_9AGAM|nr:hypothetical protein PISMIDRAFT_301264 [Pisolithus microcarpus 441]